MKTKKLADFQICISVPLMPCSISFDSPGSDLLTLSLLTLPSEDIAHDCITLHSLI